MLRGEDVTCSSSMVFGKFQQPPLLEDEAGANKYRGQNGKKKTNVEIPIRLPSAGLGYSGVRLVREICSRLG